MTIQPRQVLYSAAIAAGLAVGAFGIASAASTQTAATNPPAVAAPTVPGAGDGDTSDPAISSSVTVPDQPDSQDTSGSDTKDATTEPDESAALASAAKITEQQARDTASKAAGGTATKATLDNENGSVVWSVEVTRSDNTSVDFKIDAGNGTVLAQDAGHDAAGQESKTNGKPDTDKVEQQDGPDNETNNGAQSGDQNGGGQ